MPTHTTPPGDAAGIARAPRPGQTVLAFLPFMLVSALHLFFKLTGQHELASMTKWLLMPLLALAVLWATPLRRSATTALLVGAITLSWIGDISLIGDGPTLFVLGLVFFLLAHIAYLVLFVKGLGFQRPRRWAVVYVLWWLAFVALLGPSLGAMLLPVALYGVVLGAMAAWASRGTAAIAAGAALFLVSDTLLGSNKFLDSFQLWQSGFLVMLSYLAGQGLIAWGVIAVQRRAAAAQALASSPAEPG